MATPVPSKVQAEAGRNRCRQLVRCLRLRRIVAEARRVDLAALAEQLGVSTRTIRRDLTALRWAGEPVPSGNDQDIGWS